MCQQNYHREAYLSLLLLCSVLQHCSVILSTIHGGLKAELYLVADGGHVLKIVYLQAHIVLLR